MEVYLLNESAMFNPLATLSAPAALAGKGTEQYSDATAGVDLYHASSYGSAWSCLRSKFTCAMEGLYQSKDAKGFQGAGHVN